MKAVTHLQLLDHVLVVIQQEVFTILQSLSINNLTPEPKLPL